MSLFVNPKRVVKYTPLAARELPVEQRTVFLLKTLSHREWEERQDYSRVFFEGETQARINIGTWIRWTLLPGLVGVEGPAPAPFKAEGAARVSDEFLDCLRPDLRQELAREIEAISKLAHDDPKE